MAAAFVQPDDISFAVASMLPRRQLAPRDKCEIADSTPSNREPRFHWEADWHAGPAREGGRASHHRFGRGVAWRFFALTWVAAIAVTIQRS